MDTGRPRNPDSWFRTPAGKRYGLQLAGIVVAKIVVLLILYFLFIGPQTRADTSADALRAHLLHAAPNTGGTTHD